MDKITGKIEEVSSSTGTGAKGDWIRWVFKINGKNYSTFDENIGKKFKIGDNVEITGQQRGQYWNMKTMDYTEEASTASESDSAAVIIDLLRQILAELKNESKG